MIKTLKLSEKSVSKFKTHKNWNYSTFGDGNSIILEQGDGIPLFADIDRPVATEQNASNFNINIKYGKEIKGTFFRKESKYYDELNEPVNQDGSYQRVVYNTIKHLFYNDYGLSGDIGYDKYYKNPMHMFGSESGQYTSDDFISDTIDSGITKSHERRVLGDSITVLEISSNIFGEKIKPSSLKITDHSSKYESIVIEDDGNTNLLVGAESFNNISEIRLNSVSVVLDDQLSTSDKLYFDYSDISFGYSVASYDDYFISGSPVFHSSVSDIQSGRAALYKHKDTSTGFELIKNFYCPFTQNGLAQEMQNDNTGFLLTEIGNIISTNEISASDEFGKSVDISNGICAIGSPNSSITGIENAFASGHVFIYEKNKGGLDNWGLINVLEGEPASQFGNSVSVYKDYIAVGSPGHKNGTGCVYVYKKTKRTKSHPWIKTSNVYESYEWNDILKIYEGSPEQNDTNYIKYLKNRSEIVSKKIENHKKLLDEKLLGREITQSEYESLLTTEADYSQVYPFNFLYADESSCEGLDINDTWYKNRIWNKNTHPSVRCKSIDEENYYNKSVWPGYMTSESDGSYIPNPDHEQNKVNKWAYRWKVNNVSANNEPLNLFSDNESTCLDEGIASFGDDNINSFGDKTGFPSNEYTESPDMSIGDYTYDLIGMITPPTSKIKKFGEVVKLIDDKIYITNPSSEYPRCYSYHKSTNSYGCEVWKHSHTISETDIYGHSKKEPNLAENMNSVSVNYNDSYIEIEICPSEENYTSWIYKIDSSILETNQITGDRTVVGGTQIQRSESKCINSDAKLFSSKFNLLNGIEVSQIPHNYGKSINISNLFGENSNEFKFYSKSKDEASFVKLTPNSPNSPIGISWKNFRENISFVYPNVESGINPSFMTIYSNEAKLSDGSYDPKYTLAEIGAQETLDGSSVKLIFNCGLGDTEFYYNFIYRGSIEGTHFTLNELKDTLEFDCTLPPNLGIGKKIAFKGDDPLHNKREAMFFSKDLHGIPYKESWKPQDDISISWKNFRENVSFSYPSVAAGTSPCIMTIYFNEAKDADGKYNPAFTIAEIHAQETLNRQTVRLTLNTGSHPRPEYYYDFVFNGSIEGTHFTISELKQKLEYDCTLPPNQGNMKSLESLTNDPFSRFFTKEASGDAYREPYSGANDISISWKNFRENVSFSYPSVSNGNHPSFMTIYSDGAKLDDGGYDPLFILAEISASDSLNNQMVRLTLNTGSFGGSELYYDFIFNGSVSGTHCTLGELKTKLDNNVAELPANTGIVREVPFTDEDIYIGCSLPKFFSKPEEGLSYVHTIADNNEIALSWKNFRENISFEYPRVDAGKNPCFMTIYSNGAKSEEGTYDPLYILAEIGAQETLNGKLVKLIFNQTECNTPTRFYYEFQFSGTIEGTHFTLDELNIDRVYDELVSKQVISEINPVYTKHLTKIKSFGTLSENQGTSNDISEVIGDDFLNNKNSATHFSNNTTEYRYVESSGLNDEISMSWSNFRENVSFSYPIVPSSEIQSIMTIYSDNYEEDDTKSNDNHIIAKIYAQETLNGQIVRLTLNTNHDDEHYYEFIFDGMPTGTNYTLSELKTKISENFGVPLSTYYPDRKNCKVRINRADISSGFHKLYLALVDANNSPVGESSVVEFYNNPTLFEITPRHQIVDKAYKYSYNVKSQFGFSLDATQSHLIIGNPIDRSFSPVSEQRKTYTAGSAYVFNITSEDIIYLEKLYGDADLEHLFNYRFGNSVSIINNNFIVSGQNDEQSEISLSDVDGNKKVEISDFIYGSEKFKDTTFLTTEALITNYENFEYSLDSEHGDAVLKIKVDDLDIDTTKLSDIEVKADFIDDGTKTLRIDPIPEKELYGIGGTYVGMKNPISISPGCDILDEDLKVFVNKRGWSIYYDDIRGRWLLSEKTARSTDYEVPEEWTLSMKKIETQNNVFQFDLITEDSLNRVMELYNLKNSEYEKKWSNFKNTSDDYITNYTFFDLVIQLESKYTINPTIETLIDVLNIHKANSTRRLDNEVESRWMNSVGNIDSIIPLVNELNSIEPIFINFKILKKILNLYIDENEVDVMSSWFDEFGYLYLIRDILEDIRPNYHDSLNEYNVNLLLKINNISDLDIKNMWINKIGLGYLLSDLFKVIRNDLNVNFSISTESSKKNLPAEFSEGVGTLTNKNIIINSNNDTTGEENSLTWGVYRDKTELIGNYVYVYVNVLPDVKFTDSVVFIYNSIKVASNGFAYYYEIKNNRCVELKRISTNKGKYEARKQYGNSVSLSADFIYVGSPVLGNFLIDELITFGGNSVVSFGSSGRLFIEHEDINPKYISELGSSIAGSVVAYDHQAIRSTKKYYLGNVFYKNGVISLTSPDGHFTNILNNSGNNGFELEFKSTQTLYENEILCRVAPNEFNFSTNPTSLTRGSIEFDINEDGKFDINDVTYIFKYIMGITTTEASELRVKEELYQGMGVGESSRNWPANDVVLTENEDVLLMDLFMNATTNSADFDEEYILNKLESLYNKGAFDIDGDGVTSTSDAKLLIRYFMGRTGTSLTNGLVDGFGSATRFNPSDIVNHLDELTGKNIGREILKDFTNYKENDQKDTMGSYLAPYATTIGLYSGLDLVMVAKLGKPVKILPNYPINFLIKYDS